MPRRRTYRSNAIDGAPARAGALFSTKQICLGLPVMSTQDATGSPLRCIEAKATAKMGAPSDSDLDVCRRDARFGRRIVA